MLLFGLQVNNNFLSAGNSKKEINVSILYFFSYNEVVLKQFIPHTSRHNLEFNFLYQTKISIVLHLFPHWVLKFPTDFR